MTIVWRPELSVGNEIIDDDHKALIEVINKYQGAVDSMDHEAIKEVFEELFKYTEEHFEREEKLQQAVHYPYYRSHQELHRQLINKLVDINEAFLNETQQNGSFEMTRQLLRRWLIDHIIKEDLKMAPYVRGGRKG